MMKGYGKMNKKKKMAYKERMKASRKKTKSRAKAILKKKIR